MSDGQGGLYVRALKILQTNFHRSWTGQTARIFLVSRELVRRGHEVVIAAPEGSILADRAREASIPVFVKVLFRKTNRPLSFLRDIVTLGRLVLSERFDLLHTHGSQDTWATVLAHRLFCLSQPIVMTRHNTKPVRFHVFNRWLYRFGIDRLVVVSRATLDNYQRFFHAGILHNNKVAVIHSCVDTERFAGPLCPERIRAELGISPEIRLIGLIGRASRDKGHLVLLDAIPKILKEVPDATFIFVGKVGVVMKRVIENTIHQRGLERSVRLLGFREDIADITAALDVSVLPSLGTDSSPAVLKEALLLGKPVVASRIAGIPEIVKSGQGILVAPGNAGELATAIVRAIRQDSKAQATAEVVLPDQFTPGFLCASYLQLYEEMLREEKLRRL